MRAAMLDDEALAAVVVVLEGEEPAGPSFVHGLATVAEACALCDVVYFDLSHDVLEREGDGVSVASRVANSELAGALAPALQPLPPRASIDARLEAEGRGYRFIEFIQGFGWTLHSLFGTGESETHNVRLIAELLLTDAAVFHSVRLVTAQEQPTDGPARDLFRRGVPIELLLAVEGLARRWDAIVALALRLQACAYPALSAVPFYLAAVWKANLEARTRWESVRLEAKVPAQCTIGDSKTHLISWPSLERRVLAAAGKGSDAVASAILELRHEWAAARELLREEQVFRSDDSSDFGRPIHDALRSVEDPPIPSLHPYGLIWDVLRKPPNPPRVRAQQWVVPGTALSSSSLALPPELESRANVDAFAAAAELGVAARAYLQGPYNRQAT